MEQKEADQKDEEDCLRRLEEQRRQLEKEIEDNRPNVLIYGMSGAGKSTLINRLFGSSIAKVGAGEPVTKSFELHRDVMHKMNLYDSKGLEVGQPDKAREDTQRFLDDCMQKKTPIHMIWYVVSACGARLQPYEVDIINVLFAEYPLFVVLSKKDVAREDEIASLVELCKGLENCRGVYPVTTMILTLKTISACPLCNGRDLLLYQSKFVYVCDECHHRFSAVEDDGLEKLVAGTVKSLPDFVANTFQKVQEITLDYQDNCAREMLRKLWTDNEHLTYGSVYNDIFCNLLAVWGSLLNLELTGKTIGKIVKSQESCNFITSTVYASVDRVRKLLGKEGTARLFIAATAVFWYRRLRQRRMEIILQAPRVLICIEEARAEVLKLYSRIESEGFEVVLNEKLQTLKELQIIVELRKVEASKGQ